MKNKIRVLVATAVVVAFGVFAASASAWSYPPTGYPWCWSGAVGSTGPYYLNGVYQGTFRCVSSPYGYWWVRL